MKTNETGTLYIIATPIGNLGDITYRAVETLQTLDILYCEDTRDSQTLLKKYGLFIPELRSYHAQSTDIVPESIKKELALGRKIGYITDAGTPGVSDPGSRLVQVVRDSEIPFTIIPIPGVSAFLTLHHCEKIFRIQNLIYFPLLLDSQ